MIKKLIYLQLCLILVGFNQAAAGSLTGLQSHRHAGTSSGGKIPFSNISGASQVNAYSVTGNQVYTAKGNYGSLVAGGNTTTGDISVCRSTGSISGLGLAVWVGGTVDNAVAYCCTFKDNNSASYIYQQYAGGSGTIPACPGYATTNDNLKCTIKNNSASSQTVYLGYIAACTTY